MSKSDNRDESYWEDQIKRWHESGVSRREYCRRAKISYWAFRDRVKKLERREPVKLVKVAHDSRTEIADVQVSGIEMIIKDKITIRVNRGFDGELLREVLGELGVRI